MTNKDAKLGTVADLVKAELEQYGLAEILRWCDENYPGLRQMLAGDYDEAAKLIPPTKAEIAAEDKAHEEAQQRAGGLMEQETCCVADQFCDAPANVIGARAYAVCFCCGQAVCTKCSSRRLSHMEEGRKRYCNECQIEYLDEGSDKVVMRRMRKLAGY